VVQPPPFQDAIHDRRRQILVVEDTTPLREVLVGGEDHRAAPQMPLVDHVEEHVGGIRAVAEVAHLVHHQDIRVGEARQQLREFPLTGGQGKLIDELRGGEKEGVEAVLDGPVGDGYGQAGLALMQSFA
jgi:hypothetical protein